MTRQGFGYSEREAGQNNRPPVVGFASSLKCLVLPEFSAIGGPLGRERRRADRKQSKGDLGCPPQFFWALLVEPGRGPGAAPAWSTLTGSPLYSLLYRRMVLLLFMIGPRPRGLSDDRGCNREASSGYQPRIVVCGQRMWKFLHVAHTRGRRSRPQYR